MKYLKVILWGNEIGRLAWNSATRRAFFMYNPDIRMRCPNFAPLLSSGGNENAHLPIYGDDRPIYQGLPPFIADSLPDSWGNTLFDKWIKENKIPRNRVTPLYKLMFIGSRGMGALEYEPCAEDLAHTRDIDIKSLYDMSLKILEDRDRIILSTSDELTLQALLAVGTSAGGRQMKAIIAINRQTGEIRSGQTDGLDGYDYYILKFGDKAMPIAEIETAYFKMSRAAGINMSNCTLMPVEGVNHFLTKRFDRQDGKKIHMQTLAAINPDANSYEELVATCRALQLPESEIEQIFARMVFNVLAYNTDDHSKNFSFLLREGTDQWELAPAYDVTFIFNTNATGPNLDRRLSIDGKTHDIAKADLLDFASHNNIRNANEIMSRVVDAIGNFNQFATESYITQPWRGIIQKTLDANLASFGFKAQDNMVDKTFTDEFGRKITDFGIAVNSKGHIDVTVTIDGKRHRRFIRQNMDLYTELTNNDIFNLTLQEKIRLMTLLFPTAIE